MKRARAQIAVEYSCGNVFKDLGLDNPEALLAKADMMHAITRMIHFRRITQKQAAELTGLSRSDISNLARNKIDHVSEERLLEALRRLA